MNKSEDKIRTQLMVKRQLILSQLNQKHEEQLPSLEVVRLQLSYQMQRKLDRIAAALERIEQGNFGRCLSCHREIGQERLESTPEAELCIYCQQTIERTRIHYHAYAHA
jgi:RNA polymerase-binding transcription factor DksA